LYPKDKLLRQAIGLMTPEQHTHTCLPHILHPRPTNPVWAHVGDECCRHKRGNNHTRLPARHTRSPAKQAGTYTQRGVLRAHMVLGVKGCHTGCTYSKAEAHRAPPPKHKQSIPCCLLLTLVGKPKAFSATQNICRNAQAIQKRHASRPTGPTQAPDHTNTDMLPPQQSTTSHCRVSWYSMLRLARSAHTPRSYIAPNMPSWNITVKARTHESRPPKLAAVFLLVLAPPRQHQGAATPQCIIFAHLTARTAGTACPQKPVRQNSCGGPHWPPNVSDGQHAIVSAARESIKNAFLTPP
jgi:hypothetical protein